MPEIKSASITEVVMDLLRTNIGGFSIWNKLEKDIVLMIIDLPEPNSEENVTKFKEIMLNIKTYLVGNNFLEEDLVFIDNEIKRYTETKVISLYIEEEDSIPKDVIDKYAHLGMDTEGVIGIHQEYNFSQLNKLSNGVFRKTGLVKFYISREKTLYGKITAAIYEHSQKIPIATLLETKRINQDIGEPEKKIFLFGEKFHMSFYNKIKEVSTPFFVYRFITEDNNEYVLLTSTQCEIGDYFVTGVTTHCDDYKAISESARLLTKLPFFFAQSMRSRVIKFANHDEFLKRLEQLEIKENIFNYPFTMRKWNDIKVLKHPKWFKWLIWAWLTHEPKGMFNTYPLHIMWLGPKASGKSLMLNSLHSKSKEARSIFSGSSSTLKHLIPSFKYNPARLGYLLESNRFSFCDEFLRCLITARTSGNESYREEAVAFMNDLLEFQKREAGSGVSKIDVINMTSRVIAATNPIRGIHTVEDLINTLDESFLCRWLIYYQTEDHVKLIRDSNDSTLENLNIKIDVNDWISLLDYLHTFSAEYDMDELNNIYNSIPRILSENLIDHYDARHRHHLECLIDGIIKTRCLLEKDMTFKAKPEDYAVLKDVWFHVIRSWINAKHIRNMDIKDRINYLPETAQFLFSEISKFMRSVSRDETLEIGLKNMTKDEYNEAMVILMDMGLLEQIDANFVPYYSKRRTKQGSVSDVV